MLFDPSSSLTNVKKALLSITQTLLHPVTFIQKAIPEFLDDIGLDFMKEKVIRDLRGFVAKMGEFLLKIY